MQLNCKTIYLPSIEIDTLYWLCRRDEFRQVRIFVSIFCDDTLRQRRRWIGHSSLRNKPLRSQQKHLQLLNQRRKFQI